jgi:rhamnogalacturonyl hydrolase YesR
MAKASEKPELVLHDTGLISSGSAGDPASLGVAATLLGKLDKAYHAASLRQRNTLLRTTPRFENGAISHRVSVAELWSDFTYMALPFLAFSAFESRDDKLFADVVRQCALQKEILLDEITGLWCHVIGPEKQDEGLWSSGNGWAVCGLVRVFALLQKYKAALPLKDFPTDLECSLMDTISHILRAAAASDSDETGLLRNYLNDASYFGEVAGTAAICSATFRMAALKPSAVTEREISWAKNTMKIVLSHTGEDGVVTPVANPMNSHDRKPCLKSAEGQAFVLHMIAAHRDWDMLPNTYTDNSMI